MPTLGKHIVGIKWLENDFTLKSQFTRTRLFIFFLTVLTLQLAGFGLWPLALGWIYSPEQVLIDFSTSVTIVLGLYAFYTSFAFVSFIIQLGLLILMLQLPDISWIGLILQIITFCVMIGWTVAFFYYQKHRYYEN
jgi:hypothetical protein